MSSVLCESKAKTNNNCQGKCALAKQLDAQQGQAAQGLTVLLKGIEEIFMIPLALKSTSVFLSEVFHRYSPTSQTPALPQVALDIWQPPRV